MLQTPSSNPLQSGDSNTQGADIRTLAFDPNGVWQNGLAGPAIECLNFRELEPAALTKAKELLSVVEKALQAHDVDAFNEAKNQLCQYLKKQGSPVTQWNLLVLQLARPEMLRGAELTGINLSMVGLRAKSGAVSLEGANLQDAQFLCADLSLVNLASANLTGADFRYADLQETNLDHALLTGADLSNAKLSFASLRSANLYCAKLNAAVLKQAVLEEANLRKTDLRNTDFFQAFLKNARLQQADLREANLFMANLSGARLRHADLKKAQLVFAILHQCKLKNARLHEANLTSAEFIGADLQGARLSQALFNRAILREANLKHACLHGAQLEEAEALETAHLKGASYDQDTVFPKGFRPRKHHMINSDTWYKLAFKRVLNVLGGFSRSRGAQEQPSH